MKTLKRTFGETYIKFKIRSGRGTTFTNEIEGLLNAIQRGGVIILLINTYFHVLAPLWLLVAAWLLQRTFEYFMGWLDEKHLKWWAFENHYLQNNKNINPFQNELLERIKNIENKLS